ncbi:MAG: hypothetical protein ACOX3C_04185 [Bacilli bacterium]
MNIKRFLMIFINSIILFVIFFMLTRSLWTLLLFMPPYVSLFLPKEKSNG